MPLINDQIKNRFAQLAAQAQSIRLTGDDDDNRADTESFYAWVSSALNVIKGVFGQDSPHYERLSDQVSEITNNYIDERLLQACRGIFLGAKSDVDGGHLFDLESSLFGEIFGDFVSAAKFALSEGNHIVAAILACAALEDALKRYAFSNGLSVENKTMDEVINALKSKGLVSGSQKSLLSAMPKIRNNAMHADWQKITPQDAGSVVGFVEQFLLTHFS